MIGSTESTKAPALDSAVALPAAKIRKLEATVVNPFRISEQDKSLMYLLMRKYYADITEQQFLRDLSEKNDVIILRDLAGTIQGFSTLLSREVESSRGLVRTVFSGDTVVEREYWGTKDLGIAFLRYLFVQKLKTPFRPLYWMLMSKGYKTYLLMANNFRTHYPRFEASTPTEIQAVMDAFYTEKFGADYDAATGIIAPHACKLREGVAVVTEELRRKVVRVDYFATRNPRWEEGFELACLAEMTLYMPLYYFLKKTFSKWLK